MDGPNPDTPPMARRVEVREFLEDMAHLLGQVREGASFLITSDGEVAAELRPHPEPEMLKLKSREGLIGAMRGQVWMADDWDTWPESFIEEMTEGPIFPPEDKGE